MALISKNQKEEKKTTTEDFYTYIKKLRCETTVNGCEVKNKFSWYKKVLGLL